MTSKYISLLNAFKKNIKLIVKHINKTKHRRSANLKSRGAERFMIWFFNPFGETNLLCKNHSLSIVIDIIRTEQASNGHINTPPAIINSLIVPLTLFYLRYIFYLEY